MNLKIKFLSILAVILCAILIRPTSGIKAQQAASWGTSISWSPDGKQIAASDSIGVSIYGGTNRLGALRSFGQPHIDYDVSWSPDGSKLITANADSFVRVWDARNSKLLATLAGHTKSVNSISWDPDGSKFASVGDDGKLILWTVKPINP